MNDDGRLYRDRLWRSAELDEDGSCAVWDFLLPADDWLQPVHSAYYAPQVHSPVFQVGKASWRLLAVYRADKMQRGPTLGVFLECVQAKDAATRGDSQYECSAWFRFQILQKGKLPHEAESANRDHHRFHRDSSDWGFASQISIDNLNDPEYGALLRPGERITPDAPVGPFQEPSSYSVHIRITIKDTSEPPFAADAEAKPGVPVGLRNQGATCYLNSVLQMLFHLSVFRDATYRLPVEFFVAAQEKAGNAVADLGDDFRKTLPFALAKLFWAMQTQRKAVSTTCLTESFGWARADALEQHDVQELLRKLIDNLEEKMKETTLKGVIPRLFYGKMRSYVKCHNIPFESERQETFGDIQVTVRDHGSLEEALRAQLEKEELCGENKYHACDEHQDHGHQDACKGTEWLTFPPVLMLHLRRFEYDVFQDAAAKVMDRLSFPLTLDMAPYIRTESGCDPEAFAGPTSPLLRPLHCDGEEGGDESHTASQGRSPARSAGPEDAPPAPPAPPQPDPDSGSPARSPAAAAAADDGQGRQQLPYMLHSVLVHSGTSAGGHYYAFVRSGSGQWFKFDDNKVTPATETQAVVENYGGKDPDRFWLSGTQESCTSAYMLVYVDKRHWNEACSQGYVQVPRALHDVFRKDEVQEERRRQEREEAHLFLDVELCTSDALAQCSEQSGLQVDLKPPKWQSPEPLRVRRDTNWADFQKQVASYLAGEPDSAERVQLRPVRLFAWQRRNNRTERPYGPLRMHRKARRERRWSPADAESQVDEMLYCRGGGQSSGCVATVQLYAEEGEALPDTHALLFVKQYEDVTTTSRAQCPGRTRFLCTVAVDPATATAGQLAAAVNQRAGRAPDAPIALWEEVRATLVVPLSDPSALLQACMPGVKTGDIVIAQFDPPPQATECHIDPGAAAPAAAAEPPSPPGSAPAPADGARSPPPATAAAPSPHLPRSPPRLPSRGPVAAYYWLATKKEVTLIDKDAKGADPIKAVMHVTDTYQQVLGQVAELVGCERTHLRLHRAAWNGSLAEKDSEVHDTPEAPQTLALMLIPPNHGSSSQPRSTLYFERLPMALSELRQMLELRVTYVEPRRQSQQDGAQRALKCVLAQGATIADAKSAVIAELRRLGTETPATPAAAPSSSGATSAPTPATPAAACSAPASITPDRLRMLRVVGNRIEAMLVDHQYVEDAIRPASVGTQEQHAAEVCLRAEIAGPDAPLEDADPQAGSVVSVCHYEVPQQWGVLCYHSTPVVATLVPGERRDDFLCRLAAVLGISKAERVKAWKLSVIRRDSHDSRDIVSQVIQGEQVVRDVVMQAQQELLRDLRRLPGGGSCRELKGGINRFLVYLGLEHRAPAAQVNTKGIEIKG